MKFTLGTVTSGIQFDENLKLIKSSLLYADEIELIGIAEYAVFKYLPRLLDDAKEIDEIITCFVPFLKSIEDEYCQEMATTFLNQAKMIEPYKSHLNKKKRRTPKEIIAQEKTKQVAKELRALCEGVIEEVIKYPASQDIKKLIDKEIITVFDYNLREMSVDKLIGGFIANLLDAMKHDTSYPLFDDISAAIFAPVIKEKAIDFCNIEKEVLRHAGVATEVLMTLPALESASVDEVLDFKKDLKVPLDAFRSAIYSFSEKMESLPWDESFKYECLKLYYAEVVPKVNEINEISSETSVLKNFGSKMLADGEVRRKAGFLVAGLATTLTTGLNMVNALGTMETLLHADSTIGLTVTAASSLLKTTNLLNQARKETNHKKREARNNVMYYYYKAQNELDKG